MPTRKTFKIYVEVGSCPACKQTKVRVDGSEDVNNCDCDKGMNLIRAAYVTLSHRVVKEIVLDYWPNARI